jgi:hypothetical protein
MEILVKQDPNYYKAYYAANRERLLDKMKRYGAANRDKRIVYGKQYYAENLDSIRAQTKTYRERNREKINEKAKIYRLKHKARDAARLRNYRLRRKFGITQVEYDALLLVQHGVCALCDQPCVTGVSLAVDHCHKTLKVRGLLCLKCNVGVGMYEKFDSARVREYLGR